MEATCVDCADSSTVYCGTGGRAGCWAKEQKQQLVRVPFILEDRFEADQSLIETILLVATAQVVHREV